MSPTFCWLVIAATFPEIVGKRAMPTLDVSTKPTYDVTAAPIDISVEHAVGVEAHQLILQLGCALARLAAREDDARENAGTTMKRE